MRSIYYALPAMLLLAGVFPLGLTGCRGNTSSSTPVSLVPNSHTVTSQKGYAIDIPNDWHVEQDASKLFGCDMDAVSPKLAKFSLPGLMFDYIQVKIAPLNVSMTSKEYCEAYQKRMALALSDYQAETPATSSGAGFDRVKVVCQGTLDRRKRLPMRETMFVIVKDMKGYVIECVATPETYADFATLFDEIGNSFRIK